MTTYSTADVILAVSALADEAIRAGVLAAGSKIAYSKGSSRNGVSPKFDALTADGDLSSVSFLPRFTYKSTAREMVFAIDAARLAFNAVNNRA